MASLTLCPVTRTRPPVFSVRRAVLLLAFVLLPRDGHGQTGCAPVSGLRSYLTMGRVILLGELHGTKEAPAFVESVVCHGSSLGLRVTVALELPQVEGPQVDRYLRSNGSFSDRAALVRAPFWFKDYQDGRSSQAMLALLEAVRSRIDRQEPIDVVLLDRPEARQDRDAEMANRLLVAVGEAPTNLFVVLTGNLHNRITEGSGRLGHRILEALGPERVLSLNQAYSGGSAWVCMSDSPCGSRTIRGRAGSALGVEVGGASGSEHYHGTYGVGEIHASPPAKELLDGGE